MEKDLVKYEETKTVTVDITSSFEEMATKLVDMKKTLTLVQRFFKEVMVEGQDYGIIPGTERPTLLKAGAEKLCELYGYAPVIKEINEEKNTETGFYRARVVIALIHRKSKVVVAEGVGEANTMENRYRWRWVPEWKLPEGTDTSKLQYEIKADKKGKKIKFYKLENTDPWTLWNTVLKMAKKRALIDATLSATRSSGIFTQDVEDLAEWVENAEVVDALYTVEPEPSVQKETKEEKSKAKTDEKISIAQAKRMFALANDETIVRQVLNEYGYEHSKDVLKKDYDEICKRIEELKKEKEAEKAKQKPEEQQELGEEIEKETEEETDKEVEIDLESIKLPWEEEEDGN
jgi:hypothetical protein